MMIGIVVLEKNSLINELIGIPYQLIIGIRDLKENLIEFKDRLNNDTKKMSPDEIINLLINKLTIINDNFSIL